jgi:hypothetical protein
LVAGSDGAPHLLERAGDECPRYGRSAALSKRVVSELDFTQRTEREGEGTCAEEPNLTARGRERPEARVTPPRRVLASGKAILQDCEARARSLGSNSRDNRAAPPA